MLFSVHFRLVMTQSMAQFMTQKIPADSSAIFRLFQYVVDSGELQHCELEQRVEISNSPPWLKGFYFTPTNAIFRLVIKQTNVLLIRMEPG